MTDRSTLPFLAVPALLIALSPAGPLMAQEIEPPHLAGDLAYAVGNAALGGLAAAVGRSLRGGSFREGFLGGAAGGAIAYGGRRFAAADFEGAGFVGRAIGSVGGSWVHNAAAGRKPLDEVVLPLGVVRVYAGKDGAGGRWSTRVRIDVPTVLVTAYLALRSDADFDPVASLSAGALLFHTHERHADSWQGLQAAGVIWLKGDPWDAWPDVPEAVAASHERVHVLQYDFSQQSWGRSVDQVVYRHLPGGQWLESHLDLGLHIAAWGLADTLLPYPLRPWEREAHFLSGSSSHPD